MPRRRAPTHKRNTETTVPRKVQGRGNAQHKLNPILYKTHALGTSSVANESASKHTCTHTDMAQQWPRVALSPTKSTSAASHIRSSTTRVQFSFQSLYFVFVGTFFFIPSPLRCIHMILKPSILIFQNSNPLLQILHVSLLPFPRRGCTLTVSLSSADTARRQSREEETRTQNALCKQTIQ